MTASKAPTRWTCFRRSRSSFKTKGPEVCPATPGARRSPPRTFLSPLMAEHLHRAGPRNRAEPSRDRRLEPPSTPTGAGRPVGVASARRAPPVGRPSRLLDPIAEGHDGLQRLHGGVAIVLLLALGELIVGDQARVFLRGI